MTTAATTTAVPFRFFDARVTGTRSLGRSMVRITFGGPELTEFATGGRDQRFKLFLPQPGQDAPVVPVEAGEEWFSVWRAMDPETRGVMRTYTVRDQRRADDGSVELDVDFALHGADSAAASGPAARWAARAEPGDRAVLLGPIAPDNAGVDFRPPAGTDWVLVTGDETALPAVSGILRWLPAGTPARVWIEVPHAEDIQRLDTEADAEIVWLVRDGGDGRPRTGLIPDAVRAASLPEGTAYAWIAGEAGTVRTLRRHLVGERGFDREAVMFTGYWRRGATEEQLIEEAVTNPAPSED
ncbi:siderophore-interacting protein [Streptomyces sp. SAJ15]|uniref:siderophore-interacting protein n=1 Tax=Streptomyces sp. SAJ15 TaxID=2011095 RepID=UPI001186F074|nr:siderophore-interacting protein [Streptomyces sp. SAJ15]TVL93789.1 NADPH-dependent ferric siderophore reductase [Streptomyces sp. SAJ15]